MTAYAVAELREIITKMAAEIGYRLSLGNIVNNIGGIHGSKLF